MNSPVVKQMEESSPIQDPLEEDDARWQLVLRIAQSTEFKKSTRLREFLLYVCRKALKSEEVHEQQIGIEVFGRRPDYNPAEDNIVRVEAREIRKRLDRFFSTEGQAEPLRVRIPKGSYIPCFEPNAGAPRDPSPSTPSTNSLPQLISSAPLPEEKEWGHAPTFLAKGRLLKTLRAVPVSTLVLGALVVVTLIAHFSARTAPQTLAAGPPAKLSSKSGTPNSIWRELFPSSAPMAIVIADSSLVLAEEISGKVVPLTDYRDSRFVSQLKGPEVPLITPRRYTDSVDVLVTSELLQSGITRDRNVAIRYPRDLKINDLDSENLIFLGSSYSDPWIKEFDDERQFILGIDDRISQLCFMDRLAHPAEAERYCSGGHDGRTDETYGLVTFLPNLRTSGNVLILEGTNSEGTEAAGDFISEARFGSAIRDYLGVKAEKPIPYFQLLLKTKDTGDGASKLEVVAHRTLSPFRS